MGLYQRNGMWWASITIRGQRVRRSTGTADKDAAQEFHDRLKADLWRTTQLGQPRRMSWREAAVRWVEEKQLTKRSIKDDKAKIKALDPFLGDRYLDQIDHALVLKAISAKSAAGATKNRYVSLIRAILNMALREWGGLDRMPRLPKFEESSSRVRFIDREAADRLVAELPPHMSRMCEFSLQTGLRAANVLGLRWDWVLLDQGVLRLPAEVTKGKKPLHVPYRVWRSKSFDHSRVCTRSGCSHMPRQGGMEAQPSPIVFSRSRRRPGVQPVVGQASKTSIGTIYDIPGRVGMS